ncbi:UTP-glucose-1-phosphate uridylyltransferase [Halalkalibacter hemicellulosilyticusJCM 9152]|uniref:UTP-glucose-1-phosphate uridylyltransferase n=1 Tax=Halalkalibacter hemicellulosilyticusJCM 9152 TaxID=1236971 RepID=W4QJF1_9BACI|nr:UTP-glucose-1-phosphate uridylyltransferase [Halalkalibacter hemicellulosilyticusJCM 9152]
MGRYVLRPEIFDILAKLEPGAGNEIQLTDALVKLNQQQAVLACEFIGKRYDVGDKLGFIQATIDFALNRDDLRDDVLKYIEKKANENLVK